jgi:hypothetical protein
VIACEVLLRARSDIGFNRFNLVLLDRAGAGSNVEYVLVEAGGGLGNLAPLGFLPVNPILFWGSVFVTRLLVEFENICFEFMS